MTGAAEVCVHMRPGVALGLLLAKTLQPAGCVSPEMSGEMFTLLQATPCKGLPSLLLASRVLGNLPWSAMVPPQELLPWLLFLVGQPLHLPRHLSGEKAVRRKRVRAGNSPRSFLWKAQDTLHRKRQHNFLIKLKSVARS